MIACQRAVISSSAASQVIGSNCPLPFGPTRRSGVASRIRSVTSGAPSLIGDTTRPGCTALTRIPQVANSSDAVLVSPRSAHLLAL